MPQSCLSSISANLLLYERRENSFTVFVFYERVERCEFTGSTYEASVTCLLKPICQRVDIPCVWSRPENMPFKGVVGVYLKMGLLAPLTKRRGSLFYVWLYMLLKLRRSVCIEKYFSPRQKKYMTTKKSCWQFVSTYNYKFLVG